MRDEMPVSCPSLWGIDRRPGGDLVDAERRKVRKSMDDKANSCVVFAVGQSMNECRESQQQQ